MNLSSVKAGQKVKIARIDGGYELVHRLESLGVRPGKEITLVCKHLWRGPITILVDKTKIAIGHKMAAKIKVEEM